MLHIFVYVKLQIIVPLKMDARLLVSFEVHSKKEIEDFSLMVTSKCFVFKNGFSCHVNCVRAKKLRDLYLFGSCFPC